MAMDRNASRRPARPLPESLNRLLLIDPTHRIEWIEDPLPSRLKPTLFDRVLWWFSAVSFGTAAIITSATLTARLLS